MKIEKEQLDTSHWALTIEVPAETMNAEIETELNKVAKDASLPGFRKGKVPLSLVRKQFTKAVEAEVLRNHLYNYYLEALRETELPNPIAPPDIDIVQFESGQPLIFKATVEVEPPIELASYEGLTVVRERVEVGDAEVDGQIERLRERQAVVSEDAAPATADSLLEVDLQELDKAFLPVIGRKRESVTIDLSKSSEDFRNSLLGVRAAESRNVTLLRPPRSPGEEKQYDHYQVSVRNVKRKELPELNDEFAQSLDANLKTLDELKNAVRQRMQLEMDSHAHQRVANLLVNQVINNSRLDIPQQMLQNYLNQMVEGARKNAGENPEIPFDETLFRDHARGRAEWNIKWYLIRKKISEKEGLTNTEEEIQQELERLAAVSGKKLKAVQALYAEGKRRDQMEDDLLERKILQVLMSRARVIERTVSSEEFFAAEEAAHHHAH